MTADQVRLLLQTYHSGGSVTVMWRRDGLPARNLVSRGLLELVSRVHLPGPYPSSCGRHAWTYRLTDKGRTRAMKVLELTSDTPGIDDTSQEKAKTATVSPASP